MVRSKIRTVGEHLYWSYANLAMAHAAVEDRASKFGPVHYSIRTRLFHGFLSGTMSFRSFYDDERERMKAWHYCSYCGRPGNLTMDHLIPQLRGGSDLPENLVWACRSCNSSKQGKDVLAWYSKQQRFPPLLVLRRYLKLVHQYCETNGLLDTAIEDTPANLPFDLSLVPVHFPPPADLVLHSTGL